MLGNGVVGILSESTNKWERRAPLTPAHCARLLHGGSGKTGVARIIVQPSTKRIHHDALYEDVGCEISEDLSECGLIVGIKQPQVIRLVLLLNSLLTIMTKTRIIEICFYVWCRWRWYFLIGPMHFSPILTRHRKKICLFLIRCAFSWETR